ncbi:MAG: sulfotransferase domain-containing protein [Bacteroidales bacterium]|nr:sulfotransferase domain-containing protein [Bacteroidales bacterium]MBN2762748.1 sulfotransferase domain-containing protein [Bacteroidales bacterium]
MDDLKKIVWLASYPKSGNTWFRVFITALLHPEEPSVDINNMHPATIASSRQLFDELAGVPSADLTPSEIRNLRPFVYRRNALESEEIIYQKVHDVYALLPNGQTLFPADITRAVMYFIRNPLDVAVSFSHHLSAPIDKTISIMNNPDYAFCQRIDRLHNQLQQNLFTWSGHIKSWVDDSGLPVMVIRYEDMHKDPLKAFSGALAFIGLKKDQKEIETAVEQASFSNLKKQEEEKGFSEKSPGSDSFFRKGIVGDWKNVLSKEQVKRIVDAHGDMMKRFGYDVDV